MRICVLYAGLSANDDNVKSLAARMSEGIATGGHTVDTFDMYLECGRRISFYDYIVVISRAESTWGGHIPGQVTTFLKSAGTVSGKRCSCFISKKGMRKARTLQVLMKALESEGMYLKNSDILNSENLAYVIGKRLHVEKN